MEACGFTKDPFWSYLWYECLFEYDNVAKITEDLKSILRDNFFNLHQLKLNPNRSLKINKHLEPTQNITLVESN